MRRWRGLLRGRDFLVEVGNLTLEARDHGAEVLNTGPIVPGRGRRATGVAQHFGVKAIGFGLFAIASSILDGFQQIKMLDLSPSYGLSFELLHAPIACLDKAKI